MQTHLSYGIILQTLNFSDFDQIVTVFTENEGVIKFFAKGANALKNGLKSSCLTCAEFVYVIGKSELYLLREMLPKQHYLNLRNNFKNLNTACECLKAILETQLVHKPAPLLYQLLIAYLDKIPNFPNHEALEASFYLKILYHEGVLDLNASHFFSQDELDLVAQLATKSSFAKLNDLNVSKEFNQKIKLFFRTSK